MAVLAGALAAGRLGYVGLVVLAVAQGTLAMVFRIAEVGAIRHLVDDESLPAAVAQNTARDAAASLAGPPLGGVLYGLQRFLPFAVDAVSYLASAVVLASIRRPFHEAREHPPWTLRAHLGDIRAGLGWLWRQPFLRISLLLVAGTNFSANAVSLVLIVVTRQRGAPAAEIGLMLSVAAGGGLLGAVAARWLHRALPPRAIVLGYPWIAALVVLALTLDLPPLGLGAVLACWYVCGPTWDAVVVGLRIRLVPDALQGRVESVSSLIAIAGAALGPLVGGLLVSHLSGRATLLWLAGATALVAVAGGLARLPAPLPAAAAVADPGH
jgi:hypothetical protein